MNAQCSKCGTAADASWKFCPHCGVAIAPEQGREALFAEHEKSSVPGAFGGLFFGLIAAPILLIFGSLLSLTGLGAFLGVPMILAAIAAPLIGPLAGLGEHGGKCPQCGMRVIGVEDGKLHYCPACDKEFALVHQRPAIG